MKNYIKYIGILTLGMVACEPEFENPVSEPGAYTSGEANFANYVALGNSMTAGYADNALYITGQQNSYPNILAQQFALVGGGAFSQPLMNDNTGGLLLGGMQIQGNRRVLTIVGNDTVPAVYGGTPTTEVNDHLTGPFNNMGAPGAKSYHLALPGYGDANGIQQGTANPYFARFASSPSASIIADAVAQEPTFFTLWIGNNDVLGYATSGGTGIDRTGNMNANVYTKDDITDPEVFKSAYMQLVNQLTQTGADGLLLNIPDVTDIPFFTTVPYAPLSPLHPDYGPMIPELNEQFGLLNQALVAIRQIDESGGDTEYSIEFNSAAASPVVIFDQNLPNISAPLTQALKDFGIEATQATIFGQLYGQARQATPEDLLVLTSSAVIGTVNTERVEALMARGLDQVTAGRLSVNGVTYPLEDRWVLTPEEQEHVSAATAAYNAVIKEQAESNNLAFVDAAAILSKLKEEGISYNGGVLTSEYAKGGAFSLDGVHPSPRGYAFMANAIIDAINETYHASIPKVDISNYATVTLSSNVSAN